jgi:hypothetical protein
VNTSLKGNDLWCTISKITGSQIDVAAREAMNMEIVVLLLRNFVKRGKQTLLFGFGRFEINDGAQMPLSRFHNNWYELLTEIGAHHTYIISVRNVFATIHTQTPNAGNPGNPPCRDQFFFLLAQLFGERLNRKSIFYAR